MRELVFTVKWINGIVKGTESVMIRGEKELLYREAVRKWGKPLQIIMVMEECAELTKECSKILRNNCYPPDQLRLGEEIADVSIMLEQLAQMFCGGMQFIDDHIKQEKLVKLSRMLKSKKGLKPKNK
jgi:NTP pyrophosphatase (non-canonical NTP hydrolase)